MLGSRIVPIYVIVQEQLFGCSSQTKGILMTNKKVLYKKSTCHIVDISRGVQKTDGRGSAEGEGWTSLEVIGAGLPGQEDSLFQGSRKTTTGSSHDQHGGTMGPLRDVT